MAGALRPPPASLWPPAKLFRLFLRRGGPRLRMRELSFAPGLKLDVRGMRGIDEEMLLDDGEEGAIEELVVATVLERGRPAFASVADLGNMLPEDFDELAVATLAALDVVGPTYRRSDVTAWSRVLKAGARDGSNFNDAIILGGAADWHSGNPQPDRYFGVPLCDLTDGQMMAFRAANDIVRALRDS